MSACCLDSQCEPLSKRQRSVGYGMNPYGIIIARDDRTDPSATCNRCRQRVAPGQRIIRDDAYDTYEQKWWNHLECADLGLLTGVDLDSCTSISVSRQTKECAWCAKPKVIGKDQVKGSWMGWVHAHCHVVPKSTFVAILGRLQHRYPDTRMPYHAHNWVSVHELCKLAGVVITEEGLSAQLHDLHIKEEEPDRPPILQTPRVAMPPARPHRWASIRYEPEAESDAEPSHVRGSQASQHDEHSTLGSSESASSSDGETLGVRASRRRIVGAARSGNAYQHTAASARKRRHHRRAGPASYRTYDASLPANTVRQGHRQLSRNENLGVEDSASDSDSTDSGYNSLDDFIVPDSDTDDNSDAQYASSGNTPDGQDSTINSDDGDAEGEDDDTQDSSNQETQVYAPALVGSNTTAVGINQSDNKTTQEAVSDMYLHQQETQLYTPLAKPLLTSSLPLARGANADVVIDLQRTCHCLTCQHQQSQLHQNLRS